MQRANCEVMAQTQQMLLQTLGTIHQAHAMLAEGSLAMARHVHEMASLMASLQPQAPSKTVAQVVGETLQEFFRTLGLTVPALLLASRLKSLPTEGGGKMDLGKLLSLLGVNLAAAGSPAPAHPGSDGPGPARSDLASGPVPASAGAAAADPPRGSSQVGAPTAAAASCISAAVPCVSTAVLYVPIAVPCVPIAVPCAPAAVLSIPAVVPPVPAVVPSIPAAVPCVPAVAPWVPAAAPLVPAAHLPGPAAAPSIPAAPQSATPISIRAVVAIPHLLTEHRDLGAGGLSNEGAWHSRPPSLSANPPVELTTQSDHRGSQGPPSPCRRAAYLMRAVDVARLCAPERLVSEPMLRNRRLTGERPYPHDTTARFPAPQTARLDLAGTTTALPSITCLLPRSRSPQPAGPKAESTLMSRRFPGGCGRERSPAVPLVPVAPTRDPSQRWLRRCRSSSRVFDHPRLCRLRLAVLSDLDDQVAATCDGMPLDLPAADPSAGRIPSLAEEATSMATWATTWSFWPHGCWGPPREGSDASALRRPWLAPPPWPLPAYPLRDLSRTLCVSRQVRADRRRCGWAEPRALGRAPPDRLLLGERGLDKDAAVQLTAAGSQVTERLYEPYQLRGSVVEKGQRHDG